MSHPFPEQPLLLYPSLAEAYGVEEALLLGIYHQFAQHHGFHDAEQQWYFIARRNEWLNMTCFWDDEKLARVTSSLVEQQAISAEFMENGSIRIGAHTGSAQPESHTAISSTSPATVPSDEVQAPQLSTTTGNLADTGMMAKGPAPSFGGSTGWSRREDDELEALFREQEKRNQLLHEITLDWRPSTTTWQMLAKHSIPEGFIEDQRDEFIAYWLAQGQKKKSWDPHFIDHVKRKWVREQNRQGRESRQANELSTEVNGERYQSTSRAEKRERISKAVMDIKNVDW